MQEKYDPQTEALLEKIIQGGNRVKLYVQGRTVLGVVNQTLSGEAVDAAEFKKQVGEYLEGNAKAKDAWGIFQSIIAIAGKTDPQELFKTSVTLRDENGVENLYKRAQVAVAVAGKVYEVMLDVKASELDKPDRTYLVAMGVYKKDLQTGLYAVETLIKDPLAVVKTGEKLSINLTPAMSPQDRKALYGDENYSLTLEEGLFGPHNHQLKPIEKIASLDTEQASPKIAKLVTAGTGTGKTAIIAGHAKGIGQGIMAVPESLTSQMVADASSFLGVKPTKLEDKDIPTTSEQLGDLVRKNPYLVVSHEQLLQMSGILKGQNLYIDEAHELTLNKDNSVALDKIAKFKELMANNASVVVTATPTPAIYEVCGQPVIDVSLHMAQHDLHSVRTVETRDNIVGKQAVGSDNSSQVVTKTLELALGQQWSLKSGDIGYIDPKMVKDQVDPVAYAYGRNSHTGASVQGIVFTDDPLVTKKLATAMQQIYEGAYLAGNLDYLNKNISEQRAKNEKENTGVKSVVKADVQLQSEMVQAQKKHLADSINIEVLMILNPKLKEKSLQKLARNGKLEEEFKKQLLFNQQDTEIPGRVATALDKLEQEKQAHPYLAAYYDKVKEQVEKVGNNVNSADSLAIKPAEIDPKALGAQYVTVLSKQADPQEIERAKKLLDKGLVEKLISEGPLGTGYSNPNVLSTIAVQSHGVEPGKTIQRNQQLGRPIRDDDGRAFVGTVTDASVIHRAETATEVYSRRANIHYQNSITTEDSLSLEQAKTLAQKERQANARQELYEATIVGKGGKSYLEAARAGLPKQEQPATSVGAMTQAYENKSATQEKMSYLEAAKKTLPKQKQPAKPKSFVAAEAKRAKSTEESIRR